MRTDINLIDEVDLGASVIADKKSSGAGGCSRQPMEGLQLAGAIAADHVEGTSLKDINNFWTVQADYELLRTPRLPLVTSSSAMIGHPGTWLLAARTISSSRLGTPGAHRNHGVFVGVGTEQQGVSVAAEYDQVLLTLP